jgi:hypothetical protein
MPFKSDAQRKFLYAADPKLAEKFAKETPEGTSLPDKVSARKSAIMKKAKVIKAGK